MITATIELPNDVIKEFWNIVTYENLEKYINRKNAEKLEEKYYNKKENNYWIFESSLEAIKFLTRNRWN